MTSEIKDVILTIPIRTFLSALSTRLYSLVFLCFIYPVYDRYIFEEKCKLPDGGNGKPGAIHCLRNEEKGAAM